MVRFGFDNEPLVDLSNLRSDGEAGPDDTFAYQMSRRDFAPSIRMPGGFETVHHASIPSSSRSVSASSFLEAGADASSKSLLQTGVDLEILQTPVEQYEYTSDEPREVDTQLHSDSLPPSVSSIESPELCSSWAEDLQFVNDRYHLLASYQNQTPHPRKQIRGKRGLYDQQDFDIDLFRPTISAPRSDAPVRTQERQATIAQSRRFVFNWGCRDSLLKYTTDPSNTLSLVKFANTSSRECVASLARQLVHTKIQSIHGVPFAAPSEAWTALDVLDSNMDLSRQSLWHLASALFDPIHIADEVALHAVGILADGNLRRKKISGWLESCIAIDSAREESQFVDDLEKILSMLTRNQLVGACAIALASGNFRLATLIPLAGSNVSVRTAILQQISFWNQAEDNSYIPQAYRAIFELLAGEVSKALSSGLSRLLPVQKDRTSPSYDWRRVFGLYLWFRLPNDARLEEVLDIYDSEIGVRASMRAAVSNDIHYHLLKLYADRMHNIDTVFDTKAFQSTSLDFQHNWMLYLYLGQSRNITRDEDRSSADNDNDDPIRVEQLTRSFAHQLERMGLWQWSIFVILHLHTELSSAITSESFKFLTHKLKIPEQWIIEAQALWYRTEENHREEVLLLMSTGSLMEAHRTILQYIGPQAIISGNLTQLGQLLTQLAQPMPLPSWHSGGQLYQDCLTLMQCSPQAETGQEPARRTVARLAKALPVMQESTPAQRIAKIEMSIVLNRALLKQTNSDLVIPLGNGDSSSSLAVINAISTIYYRTSVRTV